MSDLYRKQPLPPEPWEHEDNPDWILVQEAGGGFSVLVPVCVHGWTEPHEWWNPHELEFGMCAGGHGGWVTDDE